jgi:hypothetical protein
MADKHPSGNPDLVKQHKKIQHKGDEKLAGTDRARPSHSPQDDSKRKDERPQTDNSGSRSDGGSFVGP